MIAAASTSNRPAIPRRFTTLAGADGRRSLAKRFAAMVRALAAEIGAEDSEAAMLQVMAAAGLQLHHEDLIARSVRGEPVDAEEITRAGNGAIRAMAALRAHKAERAARPLTPAELIAARRNAA